MSAAPVAPLGFGYLFEKFPSFSQTFCAREVEAMRRAGAQFPVYSIRRPADEPPQDAFEHLGDVTYLPEKFDDILAQDAEFRRAARKALERLQKVWGDDTQKRRIYEALWLGPRLKKDGVRHVHVHFAGLGARTAFWLHELFGITYSITAHANDIFRDEPPERLRQIFEKSACVPTVSEYSLAYLRENYPAQAERFCRVYNGIVTQDFPVTTMPEGRPFIVSVGRYIEKKGFSVLIEACALLGDRDFECQIVGHGPLEENLRRQIEELSLTEKVILAGPQPEGVIKQLLARSQVFALACVTAEDGALDNLPTVIMEAMAAAVPVVSTQLAAVPEMVLDGKTGYVVPEKDATALAGALAKLIDNRELARQMGGAGQVLCRELFDVEQTSASLRKILEQHGARRPSLFSFFR